MKGKALAMVLLAVLIWPAGLALGGAEPPVGGGFAAGVGGRMGIRHPAGGAAPEPWSPPVRKGPSATITVTTADDELNGDGDCSLREAIETANTNGPVDACVPGSGDDTILVPAGTYFLTLAGPGEDENQTGDLDILDNLAIQGDGAELTIIDGGTLDRVFHIHPGRNVKVEDLTVTHGYVYDNDGGGVWNEEGVLELNQVTLAENTVVAGSWTVGGGGLFSSAYFQDATATLNQCLVANNEAYSQAGIGQAAYSYVQATLILNETTVSGNTAESGGGISSVPYYGAIEPVAVVELNNSTVSGNSASSTEFGMGLGGGIEAWDAQVTLVNSTVSGNEAVGSGVPNASGLGGGVLVVSDLMASSLMLLNSTVAGNDSNVGGGGIFVGHLGPGVVLESQNSIVGGNSAPAGIGESCFTYDYGFGLGTFTSLGHNLEDYDFCEFHQPGDLINTDPLLAPLGGYGGPTETHALLTGSPAVDAGDDAAAPDTDQRGMPRPQGPASDIGAYEADAMFVQAIGLRAFALGGGRHLVFGATLLWTQEGQRVPGATVAAEWTLPNGATRAQERPTGPAGLGWFRVLWLQTGTYELCVMDVACDGYAYDPDQNVETCETIEVP